MAQLYQSVVLLNPTHVGGITRTVPFSVNSNEMSSIVFAITVSNSTAGISDMDNITIKLLTSYNDGLNWEELDYNFQLISGDGYFKGIPKPTTARIGPRCKLELKSPDGESATVQVYRTVLDSSATYNYTPASTGGGGTGTSEGWLATYKVAIIDFSSTPLLAGQSMTIAVADGEGIHGVDLFCDVGEPFNLEVEGVIVGRVFPGGGQIVFATPIATGKALTMRPTVDFTSDTLQINVLVRRGVV